MQSPPKDDICYATQNRQNAVKAIAHRVDLMLVIGSQNSSNSQRLREVSAATNVPAHLINDETEIDPEWLQGVEVVGVTAGASAPEEFVQRVIEHLRLQGAEIVEELSAEDEDVYFAIPSELQGEVKLTT
jgi:4-hydroxy-3-methylbut-2-enyl diphosphate reductase